MSVTGIFHSTLKSGFFMSFWRLFNDSYKESNEIISNKKIKKEVFILKIKIKKSKLKIAICLMICWLTALSIFALPQNTQAAEVQIDTTGDHYWNGGWFTESLSYDLLSFDNATDMGTYRIRYYLHHSGPSDSYTLQTAPVELFVDGVSKTVWNSQLGNHVVNEKRLMGSCDVNIKAGINHTFIMKDTTAGSSSEVNMSTTVYLPYASFNVAYNDWNGTRLKDQSVEKYSNATPPANPSRIGHTFAGWSATANRVTNDMTITAQYNINYYTVRYLDYNNSVISSQSIPYGSSASTPGNPSRTGYTFTGWSTNGAGITANRDIVAQYAINSYPVAFNSNGGSSVSGQSVVYQSKVTRPTDPTRTNYKFMGWFRDTALTQAYDFNSAIGASGFTLYAKWDAFPTITATAKTFYENEFTQDEWANTIRMQNVSANDKEDGNKTSNITITSDNVKADAPGNYNVTYRVVDNAGSAITKTIGVTVKFNTFPVLSIVKKSWYENEITMDAWKDELRMKDITAVDVEDGNITSNIKVISDNIDTTKAGEYQVKYQIIDAYGKLDEKEAEVEIKFNNAPVITAAKKTYVEGQYTQEDWDDELLMEDVSAEDEEDGDLTDNINVIYDDVDVTQPGWYRTTYEVTDQWGKKDTKTILTEIIYNNPPIINAKNVSFHEGEYGDDWADTVLSEVRANDKEDGDITEDMEIIRNDVDPTTPGSYEVTFEVSDSLGKTTTKTIDVTVLENRQPVLQIFAENKRFIAGQYTTEEWIQELRKSDVSAHDQEDNDLTDKIEVTKDTTDTSTAGAYEVSYKVTDRWGKSVERTIKVNVEPNDAPKLFASDKWFTTTDTISNADLLKNVTALDDHDGNLTRSITIASNEVVEGVVGDYPVIYAVSDQWGKETTKTVTVHVQDAQGLPTPPTPPVESDPDALKMWNGKALGKVEITKFMEDSIFIEDGHEDVVFGVFAAEDITYKGSVVLEKDNMISITKVDENGKAYASLNTPGKYYVMELSTNEHFNLDAQKYYFTFEK